MPKTESPLRYPGGKTKLYSIIRPIVLKNTSGNNRIYAEPFAGGAGLALQLLYNQDVDALILNDIDYHVYCFWNACLNSSEKFCQIIDECTIDLGTWDSQRRIYLHPFDYTALEVAFSTFFLNRCNVSGIISGGPIGGRNQKGAYGLDARFNKSSLIKKIQRINNVREKITFFNLDAKDFIQKIPPNYNPNEIILNIDPPYVKKGPLLYENSYSEDDHAALAHIIDSLEYKWLVTYDECDTVYRLYSQFRKEIISINYSIGHERCGRELIIYSDSIDLNIA